MKDYYDMTDAEFARFVKTATADQLVKAALQHVYKNPFICTKPHGDR